MRSGFTVFFIVIHAILSFGQSREVDSLLTVEQADTNVLNRLMQLAVPLEYANPSKALEIYAYVARTATGVSDLSLKGSAYMYAGITFSNVGEMDSARLYYTKALGIFEPLEMLEKIGALNSNIANTFHSEGNFAEAGNYHEKAIAIFEDLRDTFRLITAISNMGASLGELGLINEAIQYNARTIGLSEAVGDRGQLAFGHHNMGVQFIALNDLPQAENSFVQALEIARQEQEPYMLQEVYRSLADLALARSNYAEAEQYSAAALEILDTIEIPLYQASAEVRLARAQLGAGKLVQAEALLLGAKKVLSEVGSLHELKDCNLYLAQLYRKKGQYFLADSMMVLHFYLSDSLNELSQSQYLAGIERKYQLLKKEQALVDQQLVIERQERGIERTRALGIGLGIALFLSLAFIYSLFQQRRIRRALQQEKLATLEREKELSVANAMLEGQESERSRIAKDLHDGLGGLMWSIKLHVEHLLESTGIRDPSETDRTFEMIDLASEEVRRISHDMMPSSLELLSLEDAVQDLAKAMSTIGGIQIATKTTGIPRSIPHRERIACYRIIQELLQNAVKHADPRHVWVSMAFELNHLRIAVADDGRGFDVNLIEQGGLGLVSLRSRVKYLGGTLDIRSGPEDGSIISFDVPIQELAESTEHTA
ncbi:MAG: tetratricopeptide repeat protein [Saprospiraceae bacterium]|nr:tetratricopeptide repeat protein [Saprospiraceae bacterium]